jgi:hypothetical protein
MHAPKERLRLYVLLFIIGLPFAANAAEDPSAVGAVDGVENEAKIVAGDAVTPPRSEHLFISETSFVPGQRGASGSPSVTTPC